MIEVPDCYVCISYDEECGIFDVQINIFGDTSWIKGFDEDEENLAVDYSKKVSDHFGIQYLGFIESNNFTLKEAAKV